MSMKPGVTAQPDASISRAPRRFAPISLMTPPSIATSVTRPGAPVPSYTVPPLMTTSAIDHELQEVAIRIAHVRTHCAFPAPTNSFDRAFFDGNANFIETRLQRLGTAVPHETQ